MLKEAIRILRQTNKPSKTITRETQIFQDLLKLLGNPQKDFKSIHITGTNGKGSVALKTAHILQKAGYKTGLYTSPHIFSYLERIKINRTNIQDKFFNESILKIHEIAQKNALELTFFEYLTATGFLHFKEQKCDFASIEVGLGGRYDTTNVIVPELSIITSIGIDHQKILGSTRESIAEDKAGIIKPNIPVVVGPHAYMKPIIEEAKGKNSQLFQVEKVEGIDFEQENNMITRKGMEVLRARGFNIPDSAIQSGLLIKQPCRMQELPSNLKPNWSADKRFFFDVGHNPNAVERMLEYYTKNIKKADEKLFVLIGASKDKNIFSSLKKLEEVADLIFFIEAKHPRAMSVNEMSQYVGFSKYPHKFRIINDGNINTTLTIASADKKHKNVLICGSFFLMPQAWGFFDKKYFNEEEVDLQEQYKMQNQPK